MTEPKPAATKTKKGSSRMPPDEVGKARRVAVMRVGNALQMPIVAVVDLASIGHPGRIALVTATGGLIDLGYRPLGPERVRSRVEPYRAGRRPLTPEHLRRADESIFLLLKTSPSHPPTRIDP